MSTCERNARCTRRDVLKGTIGCGAYVAMSLGTMGTFGRRLFAQERGEPVVKKPFARVERLHENIWGVVALTAGGMQVVSNSGIIAGKDGVLVVDACNTPDGSRFIADTARKLTGRVPTHVVLTHYHGDHSNGLCGHLEKNPDARLVATKTTRDLLADQAKKPGRGAKEADGLILRAHTPVLPNALLADDAKPTEVDLGGIRVRLVPRGGHTASDVTVEVVDPRIVWCGDLVFNGLFPNYGDATPSTLWKTCNAFLKDPDVTYVPGHGPITDAKGLTPYLALLQHVEHAARDAHERGVAPADAWRRYEIPDSLGTWKKYRPDVYRFAFQAWAKELDPR